MALNLKKMAQATISGSELTENRERLKISEILTTVKAEATFTIRAIDRLQAKDRETGEMKYYYIFICDEYPDAYIPATKQLEDVFAAWVDEAGAENIVDAIADVSMELNAEDVVFVGRLTRKGQYGRFYEFTVK